MEDVLIERLTRRIEHANTYFLMELGKSIKKIRDIIPSQAEQLIQILKYGGNYEEIINQISNYTGLNINDIDDIFSAYSKKDQNFKKKFYKYRNIPFVEYEKNIALKKQTEALSNITKNEMYNFSRTNVLGYTIREPLANGNLGDIQFYGLRDTYNRVLDEALLNTGQGKESFDSAMTRIMTDIGGSGLKTIEYESGRSVRLDSAVRMHLKGRLRELHNENQLLFGEEFGADGVEISVHSNPADDHAEVQGRQFSLEEFEKLQTEGIATDYTGKVVDMHRVTKKGISASFRPISEYNCYHYVFSVVLGVSQPEYDNTELESIIEENNKKIKYDDKEYTKYECTQLQRNIEREIRKQKDIQIFAKNADNKELILKSQDKINVLTKKYQDLSNVSGLPTKLDRIKVVGYKKVAKSKLK